MINDEFSFLVLAVVSEIPYGKVASYKTIAAMCGYPSLSRQVGKVLSNAEYFGDYPCHRIVHHDGSLVSFWKEQKQLLLDEGIEFKNEKVIMSKFNYSNK